MTAKIYEQHEAAFKNVTAFVILKGRERVATIAFKFPRDGAGRLYAYVHWRGLEMVRGHANGYGYDKKSAAIENARRKLPDIQHDEPRNDFADFRVAIGDIGGDNWDRALQDAGFTVLQAV